MLFFFGGTCTQQLAERRQETYVEERSLLSLTNSKLVVKKLVRLRRIADLDTRPSYGGILRDVKSFTMFSVLHAHLNGPRLPCPQSLKRGQRRAANVPPCVSIKDLEDKVLKSFEPMLQKLGRVKVSRYARKVRRQRYLVPVFLP